jgi:hypothetical protein
VLVAGAADQEVTVTGLQVVHAALRRRKPLIVIDVSADAAIAGALAAACAATGTPLRHERAGVDLGSVIGERSAVLLRVGSAELASRACADIAALAAVLSRIGVDGDGLIWVTGGERLPAKAAAALIGAGRVAGLAVLIGTSSSVAAAQLARLVDARLILRVADPSLAAILAAPPRAVSADALLSLGRGEFVLTVSEPTQRLVALGRLVPARLPRPAAGRERQWRRLRLDPA